MSVVQFLTVVTRAARQTSTDVAIRQLRACLRRPADGVPARFWKGLKPYASPHHQPIVEANHSGAHHLDVVFGERHPLLAAEYLQQDLDSLARPHVGEDRQMTGEGTAQAGKAAFDDL